MSYTYTYMYTKPKASPIIRFIVVILMIIVCFGWLHYKKAKHEKAYANWVPVEAVVTKVFPPENKDGKALVHYSYRYYIDIPGSDYSSNTKLNEEDVIWVFYDPDDYTKSIIEKPATPLEAYAPFFILPVVILAFLDNTSGRTVVVRRRSLR